MAQYQIIKRQGVIPGEGRRVGDVWIVRDIAGGMEVATRATKDGAQQRCNQLNGITA